MTNPSLHHAHHRERAADVVRMSRVHPLADVHPLERRSVRRIFALRRPHLVHAREIKTA